MEQGFCSDLQWRTYDNRAAADCEEQKPGLGLEFLEEVERAVLG